MALGEPIETLTTMGSSSDLGYPVEHALTSPRPPHHE
jgi:hypothetical protein